ILHSRPSHPPPLHSFPTRRSSDLFYGLRRFNKGNDKPFGAVAGVLHTVLQMIEKGATHVGVATDHVIESFRNGLWPGYKTSAGRSEEHTSELQSLRHLVCRLLLEK